MHGDDRNYLKTVERLLEEEPAKERFSNWIILGRYGTYLFAQSEAGLYIVDQHAAQERIKYEYYRENRRSDQ